MKCPLKRFGISSNGLLNQYHCGIEMRHWCRNQGFAVRLACYISRPVFSEAASFALRGVLFASQICEAPEAVKGVQGATGLRQGEFQFASKVCMGMTS